MIKLIRILEYTYETPEDMMNDMSHWQVPNNGIKRMNSRETIRSATLPLEVFFEEAEAVNEP